VCSGVVVVESRCRRFVSVSRVLSQHNDAVIDAVCEEGRAWWLVLGPDNAPDNWTELLPLPRIEVEVAEQPAAELSPTAEVIKNLVERMGDGSLTLAKALEEFRDHSLGFEPTPPATLPASANRLVERVAAAIAEAMVISDSAAACAAIREVALALRDPATPAKDAPTVAYWLEREASR